MSFADQMVAKYEALLLANAGASVVTIDGTTVKYRDLEDKHAFWKRRAARASGARPMVAQIKMPFQ
jgi:hypothetical protein